MARVTHPWNRSATRRTALAALAIGLIGATGLVVFLHRGHAGDAMDDGLYLVSARALRQGLGYTLPSQVGPPIRSRYPVGLPALVAVALRAAPGTPMLARDLAIARSVIVAAFGVFLAATFAWLRRSRVPVSWAVLIALTAAFHPEVVRGSIGVLSDVPFAAVSALALRRWADRRTDAGRGRAFLNGLLSGVAMTIRGNGLSVLFGSLVDAARRARSVADGPRRSWRSAGGAGAACLAGALAVLVPARGLTDRGNGGRAAGSYVEEFSAVWSSPGAGLGVLVMNLSAMARTFPRIVVPALDTRAAQSWPAAVSAVAWGVLAVLILGASVLAGRTARNRGRGGPAGAFAAATLAVYLVWPWEFTLRFGLPLFPMALLAFGLGVDVLARRLGFGPTPRRRLGALALGGALAGSLATTGVMARSAWNDAGALGDPDDRRDLDATLATIRTRLEADAVIVAMTPEMVYLYTGRQGMLLHQESDKLVGRFGRLDRLTARMAEAPGRSFYLLGPPPGRDGSAEALQTAAYARHPGLDVRPIYRSPRGRYWLARVAPRDPGAGSARPRGGGPARVR